MQVIVTELHAIRCLLLQQQLLVNIDPRIHPDSAPTCNLITLCTERLVPQGFAFPVVPSGHVGWQRQHKRGIVEPTIGNTTLMSAPSPGV